MDIEIMMDRARLKYPDASPALITDNGPHFIANELKNYLNFVGITHRKTRYHYPQSNGKVERFYQTCKNEFVRRSSFLSLDDLQKQLAIYIENYNHKRLHSALGYITPHDMLMGRQEQIFKERRQKIQLARQERKRQRTAIAA